MADKMTPEKARRRIQELEQMAHSLQQKMSELEMDENEHSMVIKTLSGTNSDRKCFRMVGGVLVEHTVGAVLPAVKVNQTGIKKVLESLTENFRKAQKELTSLQLKYGVQQQRPQNGNNGYPEQRKLQSA
eukprot:GSMAST32.ASY1.ANO1.940.1 assembled CDS